MTSELFVNGHRAGGHVGGFVGFDVDITPWVTQGGENEILLRADNGYDPDVIPSQKSDFFIYGGITRDVWCITVPSRYIKRLAIATPVVSRQEATASIDVTLENGMRTAANARLTVTLLDRQGNEVVRSVRDVRMDPGTTTHSVPMPPVILPDLWSPSDPALYTARAALAFGGEQRDELRDRFGFRWYEFRDGGPFFLNGERLLLRGTHRHEEYAGYGAALPDTLHRKDMEMIKGVGANFVRLAHYPQDPEVYRACDELGILVWDELPWCRGGDGGRAVEGEYAKAPPRADHAEFQSPEHHPLVARE